LLIPEKTYHLAQLTAINEFIVQSARKLAALAFSRIGSFLRQPQTS
jgi:hypothetical protein